ncbi:HFL083Cp [Eremothecium sinecaudum]|uniref:HFL083Cp n=1 Tax=Eremothecium sinecaudum TaxID=45286 RepID=A0A0X8HUR9_9SACH|nr:HFL083Cp [Eremothecium sinecaudum]AMD21773.1 HFL083Cp [Eremothecium sinecaudum]
MANFFIALWESIFRPGTTPQLVAATNASFAILLAVLFSLLYVTRSGHFIALSVIAMLLWITVIWFVRELKQVNLKSNEELDVGKNNKKKGD